MTGLLRSCRRSPAREVSENGPHAGPFIRIMARVRTSWRSGLSILGAGSVVLLLSGCAVTSSVPAQSTAPSPTATPALSATATPAAEHTPAAREEPPAVATEPVAIAAQIAVAERAVRDRSVTGAALAWIGHLQQRAYRSLAARPEWRDAFLAGLPADVRAGATANLDAPAALRATVVPPADLPTAWRTGGPAPRHR